MSLSILLIDGINRGGAAPFNEEVFNEKTV